MRNMRLEFLRHLYEGPGPYASVYLDTAPLGESVPGAEALHWHSAYQQLTEQGAGADVLDPLAKLITAVGHPEPGAAAFARAGRVGLARALPAAPPAEIAEYAALPRVLPMLVQAPPEVPHLRVSANRESAELIVGLGAEHGPPARAEGEQWPVHKASGGGWSQPRFQRSAEQTWAHNEKEFAAAVTAAAQRTGADLIVLAGDVRARGLLLDHLPKALRDQVVVVDKEVPAGSDEVAETAATEIRRRAEQASRDGLDSVRTQLPRGGAAQGLADVVAALRAGRVAALFLAGDPFPAGDLWFGAVPGELATGAQELADLGIDEPTQDQAGEVLVRGAALTDAELHFIPEGEPRPTDGVAALFH
jgi:Bacterial archaeo-eukaryotic release factor family 2